MKIMEPKQFTFDVDGLSDKQLEVHTTLYKGYVNNFNSLNEDKAKYSNEVRVFAELKRRMAFEFNGIKLHEYYFDNLKKETTPGSNFQNIAIMNFGSFEDWKTDFQKVTAMRGIGWGIVYYDKESNHLLNTFVADHEIGHLASLKPILVCDLWEHAFSVDFLPTERAKYLEIFWKNINWNVVEERI